MNLQRLLPPNPLSAILQLGPAVARVLVLAAAGAISMVLLLALGPSLQINMF